MLCLLLAACGFRPLHGSPAPGRDSPAAQMAAIRIAPLSDRMGQTMHNLLRDRLNPEGQPGDPAYLLQVRLKASQRELGIRKDETATRANLRLSANFVLRDARTKTVLFKGLASSVSSFNILEDQFATTFSEANAQTRALRALSDDIRTRLGIYFSRPPDDPE